MIPSASVANAIVIYSSLQMIPWWFVASLLLYILVYKWYLVVCSLSIVIYSSLQTISCGSVANAINIYSSLQMIPCGSVANGIVIYYSLQMIPGGL